MQLDQYNPLAGKKVALFVGSDVTANLILNRAVKEILQRGMEPLVFFPKHMVPSASKKPEAHQPLLKKYAYYERTLFNDVVFPFLDKNPCKTAFNKTANQLAVEIGKKIGKPAVLEHIEKVNDPEFVARLAADKDLIGAFNIRGFQKYKFPIIKALNDKVIGGGRTGFFLNLHPGELPAYRGVMSTARAMAANEQTISMTLHHIDEDYDTGKIVDMETKPLDYNLCSLVNTMRLAPVGGAMIKGALDKLKAGNVLKGYPQASEWHYYSYPVPEVLDGWVEKGIVGVNLDDLAEKSIPNYSEPGTDHAAELVHLIKAHPYQETIELSRPANNNEPSQGQEIKTEFTTQANGEGQPPKSRFSRIVERMAHPFSSESSAKPVLALNK